MCRRIRWRLLRLLCLKNNKQLKPKKEDGFGKWRRAFAQKKQIIRIMDALLLHVNVRKRFVLAFDCHSRHLCFVNWTSNSLNFAASVVQCLEWQLVHMSHLESKGERFYTTSSNSRLDASRAIPLNWNALSLHRLFAHSNNFESFAEILAQRNETRRRVWPRKSCTLAKSRRGTRARSPMASRFPC